MNDSSGATRNEGSCLTLEPRVWVSYKERWWHRRTFVCGNVPFSEARDPYLYLWRHGRRPRIHIEGGSR